MRSRQAARRGVGAAHEPQTRHEDGTPSTTDGVWPRAQKSPTTDGHGDRSWRLSSIASISRQAQPAWVHLDDAVDAAILVAQRREAASNVSIVAEPRAYSSREIHEIVLLSGGWRPSDW